MWYSRLKFPFHFRPSPAGVLSFQAGCPGLGAADTADRDAAAAEQDQGPEGTAGEPDDHHGSQAGQGKESIIDHTRSQAGQSKHTIRSQTGQGKDY